MNSVSYVSQQRGSPWLSALEIFHNNSCLLEFRRVWYLDTYAFSPGTSRGRVRRSFLLLWLWQVIIKNCFQPLILPEFVFMKTIQEVELRQCTISRRIAPQTNCRMIVTWLHHAWLVHLLTPCASTLYCATHTSLQLIGKRPNIANFKGHKSGSSI